MKIDGVKGRIEAMPSDKYPKPNILPPACHPRLMLKRELIDELIRKLDMSAYAAAKAEFETLKDTDFSSVMNADAARSGRALGVIEAKAYEYLLFGDEKYGFDAISSIKEYIDKACFDGLADDYRAMGQTMFTAAEVYDWCNPLLNEEDKYYIVASIENIIAPRMEIGMPPCKYGVVVGHQAEAQLLRDWLSFAIAVYDDYPDIYNFVAGRFFKLYVPVRNYWYETEATLQGSSYSGYRFTWDLWSAWLFKRMTGELIYSDKMKLLPAQWLMYRRPDGQGLRDGDDYAELGGRWDQYGFPWFYAGNLFRDPVYLAQAFKKIGKRDRFFYNELTLTPVQLMIFDDLSIGEREDYSHYPLIKHYADPCGITVARTGWNIGPESRDVMVFMKIGGLWSANHHHMDFGAFQIYYRGILASDSGAYVHYGSPHDMSYNKQTIAHNCLLIYDPDETNGRAVNSGGQIMIPGEVMDIEHWLGNEEFKMGEVYAHDENPSCVYIAGDITKAYRKKVREVIRRMMFIPVDKERIHAVFAVSDKVVSSNADFKKTFMLHCQEEPQIIGNKTVIRRTGSPESFHGLPLKYDGMLINQTLLPKGAKIESLGGEGREFLINGENYPIPINGKLKASAETGWGRIEITPPMANESDEFLNVMLVCDNGEIVDETAELYENDLAVGAFLLSEAIFFPRGKEAIAEEFEIASPMTQQPWNYHVSGLKEGEWSVTLNGAEICRKEVDAQSGMLNFSALGGNIKLLPC
ncbi:MAG: heparinase II/III family protein [Clostridia bacterium]|nr:heparinase II/III family protein [Clostridia bacterium]